MSLSTATGRQEHFATRIAIRSQVWWKWNDDAGSTTLTDTDMHSYRHPLRHPRSLRYLLIRG
jgi:hypothetical protein